MSILLLERVFWESIAFALLRGAGISRRHPYIVMVRAEPVSWRDSETNSSGAGGLFASRVVFAASQAEAEERALAYARVAVLSVFESPTTAPVQFQVEKSDRINCIAWRQPGGFSLYERD